MRFRTLLRRSAAALAVLALTSLSPALAEDKGEELFSISVDGEHVAGTPQPLPETTEAATDRALQAADIQVKYDGLLGKPILNAATIDQRRAFDVGEPVDFLASSNYPGYIARQEIRIFATGPRAPAEPVATVKVGADGKAAWTMPAAGETAGLDDFVFVLRVYDAQGRFDETRPLPLARRAALDTRPLVGDGPFAPGVSDDNTAFRNIPVDGGAITVAGRNIAPGTRVKVLGEYIPVDENGSFVIQRILTVGEHDVDVELKGSQGGSVSFDRDVNIPSTEWFYVGLADVTLGMGQGSNHVEDVKPGEYNGVYNKGRAAFYLKGKIKGAYLLTAAADTGENELKNMFTGLDEKDPRSFLERINPEDYYPVYGDDSVAVEDAPTRGKFYVRLERGSNRVMWGNFKTDIRGTEFLRNDRALYGANLELKSKNMAPSGERTGEVHAYAAQPGTLPQRDVLRGTGGSAYFLSRQDLTVGSETVYVEIKNPVTGMVSSRKTLVYGRDYSIDYLQGVILLNMPLASSVSADTLVRDGALGGNDQYLVVAYEFTPAAGDVDGYVYGGRAQQWLGGHVRVGVTGAMENTGTADQKLAGADVQLYKSERTFLEGEVAVSDGPGFGFSESVNGGLTNTFSNPGDAANGQAMAYRARGRVDISDIVPGAQGDIEASYAYKQKGFSTLDEQVDENRQEFGLKGDVALTDHVSLSFYGDQLGTDTDVTQRRAGGALTFNFWDGFAFSAGAEELKRNDSGDGENGERTDAAVRLERRVNENTSAYVFGQATLAKNGDISDNNRVGIGGTRSINDMIDATGEVSYGTNGIGGRALLSYQPTAADRYYVGYALDPDSPPANDLFSPNQEDDLGGFVAGIRHGFSERLSVYAENKYDMFSSQPSLTQVYGVNYTPRPEWKLGAAVESGMVWGDTADLGYQDAEFHRNAISVTASYAPDEKSTATIKGEVRLDDGNYGSEGNFDTGADDGLLTAYYLAGRYSNAINEDWRFLAAVDAVISDASDSTLEGNYVEASAGYAYRPVDNDRLNAIAKYVFLYDLPGPDQRSADGSNDGIQQRSHIFSVDATYDLTQLISIGAKYGVRIGEWKQSDVDDDWQNSTAQLGVVRADLHVVKSWDVMIEGRGLWESETQSVDYGVLAAIYRQLSDNFELGVGYNFGNFSDDLRDLTANDHGVFINAVGKL